MKILRFLWSYLFTASKGVIMGTGFGFTAILAVLSLSVKNGILTESKVDLSTLTSGYWVYVWTISLLVFILGTLLKVLKQQLWGDTDKAKRKSQIGGQHE